MHEGHREGSSLSRFLCRIAAQARAQAAALRRRAIRHHQLHHGYRTPRLDRARALPEADAAELQALRREPIYLFTTGVADPLFGPEERRFLVGETTGGDA